MQNFYICVKKISCILIKKGVYLIYQLYLFNLLFFSFAREEFKELLFLKATLYGVAFLFRKKALNTGFFCDIITENTLYKDF